MRNFPSFSSRFAKTKHNKMKIEILQTAPDKESERVDFEKIIQMRIAE